MPEKITITLSYNEAVELQLLLQESHNTGNVEFDERMKSINEKLTKKLY